RDRLAAGRLPPLLPVRCPDPPGRARDRHAQRTHALGFRRRAPRTAVRDCRRRAGRGLRQERSASRRPGPDPARRIRRQDRRPERACDHQLPALAGPAAGAGRARHRAGYAERRARQLHRVAPRRGSAAGRTHRGQGRGARAAAERPVRPAPRAAGRGSAPHRTTTGAGVSVARGVLERLLRKGERARLRGDGAPPSLPMTTEASAGDYLKLQTLPEREAFHAGIALAERDGAIHVDRDQSRGDGERLLRITVVDLQALAVHLGVQLLETRVDVAAALLVPWRARFPVLDEVLQAWRSDRKVRGRGPEAAQDLADAARAVAASQQAPGNERILRREGVGRVGDSRGREKLTPWLEVLVTGETGAAGLPREDVWSAIDLRREPQPLLLAGSGTVELDGAALPLARPYLGVPMES